MGKAIQVIITQEQKQTLQKLRSSRAGKNIGERAYYILLSSSGKSISEISAQLGRNPHTVRCWIKRYLRFGISGLIDKSSSGRTNQLREKVKEELNQLLSASPKEYGYQQSGWQINLLLDQLTKVVGSVSATTVKRALHEHGWVYRGCRREPSKFPFSAINDLIVNK